MCYLTHHTEDIIRLLDIAIKIHTETIVDLMCIEINRLEIELLTADQTVAIAIRRPEILDDL